jgi:hypothetical protein
MLTTCSLLQKNITVEAESLSPLPFCCFRPPLRQWRRFQTPSPPTGGRAVGREDGRGRGAAGPALLARTRPLLAVRQGVDGAVDRFQGGGADL